MFINPLSVFEPVEIQQAINILPNNFGRLNQLGLMPVDGALTNDIAIEEQNGVLTLLPTTAITGPGGTVANRGKRRVRTFRIPKIVHNDHIAPEDLNKLRRFDGLGEAQRIEALSNFLNSRLAEMRAKHDITLEHMRMGALKGVILDADGSTLYDLYSEFGITAKTVSFALGTPGTDVILKCLEVQRHIQLNLRGEVMQRVHALVSPEFFDALTVHPKVEKAFANYQEAAQRMGGDNRNGFVFGNITFEEYLGSATDPSGTDRRFIAAGEAHFFPVGTAQAFRTFAAPADFNETIGQLGDLYYAKQQEAEWARGVDIHTQSNPLPMCNRPGILVKGTIA